MPAAGVLTGLIEGAQPEAGGGQGTGNRGQETDGIRHEAGPVEYAGPVKLSSALLLHGPSIPRAKRHTACGGCAADGGTGADDADSDAEADCVLDAEEGEAAGRCGAAGCCRAQRG